MGLLDASPAREDSDLLAFSGQSKIERSVVTLR
jgi:hypothetical protein